MSIGELWSKSKTNMSRYVDEIKHLIFVMRREHLPRFKTGSLAMGDRDNYLHLVRNLFTETFRALPRTLSGLLILYLLYLWGAAVLPRLL